MADLQTVLTSFLQNETAIIGAVGLLSAVGAIYLYQYINARKDDELFETVDWAEDIIAPVIRSDIQTWGETCKITFMQDFDVKYFAVKKKRFNVVSNLQERLENGVGGASFPGSEEFIQRISEYKESNDWTGNNSNGIMMFRLIKPMFTRNYWVNYVIYKVNSIIPGLDDVSWIVLLPRNWVRYSSNTVQLHKDAQFFELVDGIHYAESLDVWESLYGVHYSELHELALEAFSNQYAYINKFYPEHGMELEKIKKEAEAEKEKYQRGVVNDANR